MSTSLPEDIGYAYIDGYAFGASNDGDDEDRYPDATQLANATLTFTAAAAYVFDASAHAVMFPNLPSPVTGSFSDGEGEVEQYRLMDANGAAGVYLPVGGNPSDWGWNLKISVPGKVLFSGSLPVLSAGETYYLNEILPVPAPSGTPTTVGPPGPAWRARGDWDAETAYIDDPRSDLVKGSDGLYYVALQPSTGQDPTSTSGYWMQVDLADDALVAALIADSGSEARAELDSLYPQVSRAIITSGALTGGGDLSSDRTIGIDFDAIPSDAIPTSAVNGLTTAWTPFTPTATNFTVGNGTWDCAAKQIGKTVFVRIRFIAGSTTTYTASVMQISLPVSVVSAGVRVPVIISDGSANYLAAGFVAGGTSVLEIQCLDPAAATGRLIPMTNATINPATSGSLRATVVYETP